VTNDKLLNEKFPCHKPRGTIPLNIFLEAKILVLLYFSSKFRITKAMENALLLKGYQVLNFGLLFWRAFSK
jgi:hypothetical protein